jgi:hypothetical protein
VGEGVAFYGGGPGCSLSSCGNQISGNVLKNSEIKNTGTCYLDDGIACIGESNLGMGAIVKGCDSCQILNNTIHHVVVLGIHLTTSNDTGNHNNDNVIDGNLIYDYGYECNNGCSGRNMAAIQLVPQASCSGACITNTRISNNIIRNESFAGHKGTENPAGILIDNGGQTAPSGTLIINNSCNNTIDVCIDLKQTDGAVTVRNNAMALCSIGGVGSPAWGAHACYADDNSTSHSHDHNTYYSTTSTDVVVNRNGSTVTRANITGSYEATAVQQDPTYMSSTDLRLQVTSLLIDAGSNTNCPSIDYYGTTRPVNTTCDIGAYEKP